MAKKRKYLNDVAQGFAGFVMLLAGFACEDEFALGEVHLRSQPFVDPSPGGSHCKACVIDFRIVDGYLELCVDTTIRPVNIGLPANQLWTTGNWSVWNSETEDLACQGCTFSSSPNVIPGQYAVVRSTKRLLDEEHTIEKMLLVRGSGLDYPQVTHLYPTVVVKRGNEGFACPLAQLSEALRSQVSEIEEPPEVDGVGHEELVPGDPIASMVQIFYNWPYGGQRSCSGVLISPRHVLTAAHCFASGTTAAAVKLRVGLPAAIQSNVPVPASAITYHPSWRGRVANDDSSIDLAVVTLAEPSLSPRIKVASATALADANDSVEILGYGVGAVDGTSGYDWGILRKVSLKRLPWLCTAEHGCVDTDVFLPLVPFGESAMEKGFCHGDSGAPVTARIGAETVVRAIATARVLGTWPASRNEPADGLPFEPIGGAFAFNRGNMCGEEGAIGFIATRIDTPLVKPWLAGFTGHQEAALPSDETLPVEPNGEEYF